MHQSLFTLGPFTLTLLGLFSGIGVLAGLIIIRREARRVDWSEDQVLTIGLVGLLSAVIGARVYYALVFAPEQFLPDPMRIFAFHEGGLSIQGGLLGGFIGTFLYCKYHGVRFLQAADIFAPGIILGQAIGRIGCDVFGIPASSSVWWAVPVQGQMLHPVQMYESLLNYMLFILLWSLRGHTRRHGELFLYYLMGFGFNRFVVEFFRTNPIAFGPFTVAHVGSIVMISIAAIAAWLLRHTTAPTASAVYQRSVPHNTLPAAAVTSGLAVLSLAMYYLIHLVLLR